MNRPISVLFAGLTAGSLACGSDAITTPSAGATLWVVSASASALILAIDGTARPGSIAPGSAVAFDIVPGTHSLELRPVGGGSAHSRILAVDSSGTAVVVGIDSAGVLPVVLADSNAAVPPGASKLRVAHFATTAPPVSIWRTQPDFPTPVQVMFPFNYRDTSPYLQSTPGDWTVMVLNAVSAGPTTDTLLATPAIPVPAGQSRTVVIVDGAGGTTALVVTP